jgi:inner membrane transporter RhtA
MIVVVNLSRASVAAAPPQLLVIAGAGSVQFGSAVADHLFRQAGPGGVVFLRLVFGAVLMLAVLRPRLSGRSRRDWAAVVGFGVTLAGMNWSFYEALARLPLGPCVTIEFLGPLTLAVIGSRRAYDLVWVALAGGGVALLGFAESGGGTLNTAGILLALLAGAFWAGYILLSQQVGAAFSGLDGLAMALAVSSVLLIPAGLIQGGSHLLRPSVLLGGFAVAMMSSVIPYSLEITALRRLSSAAFGLLMSLDPAIAAIAGVLVLHQPLHLRTAIAVLMVMAASAGSTLTTKRRRPEPVGPSAAVLG